MHIAVSATAGLVMVTPGSLDTNLVPGDTKLLMGSHALKLSSVVPTPYTLIRHIPFAGVINLSMMSSCPAESSMRK